jgi:hypothetical protein
MSRYKYGRSGNSTSDKAEKSKTAFKVTMVTAFLLVPIIIYIIISTLPPNPVTGRSIDKGRFDPTVTFTTDWFTFNAPNKWEEAADLHIKDKVYVYRERSGGEYQGLMHVYINGAPINYQDYYTRVLPVIIRDGNSIDPQELSSDCSEVVPGGQKKGNPVPVVQLEVSFTCWVDHNNLYATVGEVGGTAALSLRRENGDLATYKITYQNTAFTPSESSFEEAIKSFTAK